jgi:hypothetical protein
VNLPCHGHDLPAAPNYPPLETAIHNNHIVKKWQTLCYFVYKKLAKYLGRSKPGQKLEQNIPTGALRSKVAQVLLRA